MIAGMQVYFRKGAAALALAAMLVGPLSQGAREESQNAEGTYRLVLIYPDGPYCVNESTPGGFHASVDCYHDDDWQSSNSQKNVTLTITGEMSASAEGSGSASLLPQTANASGSVIITATAEGLPNVAVTVDVLEIVLTQKGSNEPISPPNRMSFNAQPEYANVEYTVNIIPATATGTGTNYTVKLTAGGKCTFSDGSTVKTGITDGTDVTLVALEPTENDYTWTLAAESEQNPGCEVEVSEAVFKFVSVYNASSEVPTARGCHLGINSMTISDTHVGARAYEEWPAAIGHAILWWDQFNFDGAFTHLGIGDEAKDVDSNVHGYIWNDHSSALAYPHAFEVSVAAEGKYQVATLPNGMYYGNLNWGGILRFRKETEHLVTGAVNCEISVGAGVGPGFSISAGISLPAMTLQGDMASIASLAVLWKSGWHVERMVFSKNQVLPPVRTHTTTALHDWEIAVNDDGMPPWETAMGWSAGLLLACDDNDMGAVDLNNATPLVISDPNFLILLP